MSLVLDPSLALSWYFEDEHAAEADAVLDRVVEEGAVVDQHLRVHGVDGLRVVDASVFPMIPRAPTNLTTIAVAERAAELWI